MSDVDPPIETAGESDAMSNLAARCEADPTEAEIVQLLRHRYGDGDIYLPAGAPRRLFWRVVQLGYISEEGYVTRKGRQLLAQYPSE